MAWTAAQRKNLTGIRHPQAADPKDFVLDRLGAWKALIEQKVAEGEPPAALDVDTERQRWGRVVGAFGSYGLKSNHENFANAIVGFWTRTDPTFALSLVFPDRDAPAAGHLGRDYTTWHFWPAVRRYLFAIDDASFAKARAWITPVYEKLRDTKDHDQKKLRDWVVYAFSRDTAWAHEITARQNDYGEGHALLVSVTDPALALAFAKDSYIAGLTKFWALDLVESLGRGSVPVLEQLLAKFRRADEKKALDSALKIAVTLGDAPAAPQKKAAAPAAAAPSGVPASLVDPFAAVAEPKKKKKAAAVEAPPDVVTVHVPADRRAAAEAARRGKKYEMTLRADGEAWVKATKQNVWYTLRSVSEAAPETRAAWIEQMADDELAIVMRDRNGLEPEQMVEDFVLPLAASHPALLVKMALTALPERLLEIAEAMSSPSIVLRIAEVASGKKGAKEAADWLAAHAKESIDALVPAASNATSKVRDAYVAALEHLRSAGHGEAIDALAAKLGADVGAGPARAVKAPRSLPPFFSRGPLPPLVLRAGGELPKEIVTRVGEMMAVSDVRSPMPGLVALVELTTDESRAKFAWELVGAWIALGAQAADRWPLEWVGFLAGDSACPLLGQAVHEWAQKGQHARAFWAIDVLGRMGSTLAAQTLVAIGDDTQFQGVEARAEDALAEIARTRGMTEDELRDELVPDLGLRIGEAVPVSYGARRFELVLRPGLTIAVRDGDSMRDQLPDPRKDDDEGEAREAKRTLSTLRASIRKLVKREGERLERAMTEERRWTPARFRAVLFDHPVMVSLAEALVWGAYDGKGALVRTFRIDETRALADERDEKVELPASGTLGIVHPIELGAARAAWSQRLADYEIVQPFAQLAREIFDGAALTGEIAKLAKRTVKTSRVRALRRRGWMRGRAEDAGLVHSMVRELRHADRTASKAVLRFDPGFSVSGPDDFDTQTLLGVDAASAGLTAVATSELALDLRTLE